MQHRVQKLLSNFGYCSRRKAEQLIEQGRVKVNGKVITLGDKASEKDTITVNGKALKKERKVYLMFHKPIRCVTALNDSRYKTVMEYIKVKERVFPVGRLDYNSTGLLLLTNDGDFANKIMHPSNKITKTYIVETNRRLHGPEMKKLERGVQLKDGKTHPAKVYSISPQVYSVKIHEGRNRIVRRMFEAIGVKVYRLHRDAIGYLKLGSLKEGRYRKLTRKEIEMFR